MKSDPSNVFKTMSRHDLGRQAIVLLEKMRQPNKRRDEEEFLTKQCDRLLEAFKSKVNYHADAQ
jgi:hypothetical protein